MPFFDYECQKCGAVSEILVPRHDSTPECPKCGSREMKKLLSRFAAISRDSAPSCPHAEACAEAGHHHCGPGCCCHGHG